MFFKILTSRTRFNWSNSKEDVTIPKSDPKRIAPHGKQSQRCYVWFTKLLFQKHIIEPTGTQI